MAAGVHQSLAPPNCPFCSTDFAFLCEIDNDYRSSSISFSPDVDIQMPTVAINIVLQEARILAGNELYARILLDSADPDTIVNEFFAEIEGSGRTGWVNIHTDKIYEGEKTYLKAYIPLLAAGTSIPVGRHQFPMRIVVPENSPSSYESEFGSIRYMIKVSLKTNSDQSTCTEVFPFAVVARSFFDDIPSNIMKNIEYKDEIDFTCCTLPFGTVSLKIGVPRSAFRLGETICCTVKVKNRTRKTLKACSLHIVLKTQFEAISRYEHVKEKKLSEQIVESAHLGSVKSRSNIEFADCYLRISETYPPTQTYNRNSTDPHIIALSYVLKFTALPGIETEIPLVVTARGYRDGRDIHENQISNDTDRKIYLC